MAVEPRMNGAGPGRFSGGGRRGRSGRPARRRRSRRSEVAPHRVDVVDAALGVVVLGQQRAALDPVVVRLARLEPAGPRERQLVERGVAGVLRGLGVGQLLGHAARRTRRAAPAAASAGRRPGPRPARPSGSSLKLTRRRAPGAARRSLHGGLGPLHAVAERDRRAAPAQISPSGSGRSPSDTRGRLAVTRSTGATGPSSAAVELAGVERPHQLAAEVLGPGQRPQEVRAEQRRRRRVGAEEARRRRARARRRRRCG